MTELAPTPASVDEIVEATRPSRRRVLVTGGAEVPVAAVVLELSALGGRDRVAPLPVSSLHTI